MSMDPYSRLIIDYLNGNKNLDSIRAVAQSNEAIAMLNSIRKHAEDVQTIDDLERLMTLFAFVLQVVAEHTENPLKAGDLYQVAAKTLQRARQDNEMIQDSVAMSVARSMDPIGVEHLLKISGDSIPEDLMTGLLKYVVNAHPDPRIRKEYLVKLKEIEEKVLKTKELRKLSSILSSAEPGSEEALKAADALIGLTPMTAGVDRYIEISGMVANAGFYEKAMEALEKKLEQEGISDEDKVRLFVGMGDISLLQDPSIAAAYYRQALEMDNKNIEAMIGLARVNQAEQQWDEALATLRKCITMAVGKPQERMVLANLANVLKGMGQWEQAEKYMRRVRSLNPKDKMAITFYEEYYAKKEDWQRLYSTLQFHLSIEKDRDERLRITKQLSDLAMDKLGKDRATDVLKRLVLMEPQNREAREKLFGLYEESGKWRALVELCNDIVRKLPAREAYEKVELLKRIVSVYESPDKLNNPDMALNTYARIVQLDPNDVDALDRLVDGYERRGNWSEMLMVLKQKADIVTDREQRLDLYRRIVMIGMGKLSNERVAQPYMEKIIEMVPDDVDALTGLVSVYEHKREYEGLLEVLGRLIPLVEPEQKGKYLYKAAITAKDRLNLPHEALDYYEELYRLEPTRRDARMELHQLYASLGEWERYAAFLEEEVTRPMPDRRRVELLAKLGEIRMDRLDDLDGARYTFEAILKIQPHDALAQRRLEQIFVSQGNFDALKSMLREQGQLDGYINLLSEYEIKEDSDEKKVLLYLEMASTCERDLHDMDKAIQYYERAYNMDPELTDVGRRLADYYREQGYIDQELDVLTRMVDHVDDMAREQVIRERMFGLLMGQKRYEEAFEQGKKAIELKVSMGGYPDILDDFSVVSEEVEKWQDYADVLLGVAAVSSGDQKVQLLMNLADVYRERLEDPDSAVSTLLGVLDVDPRHPEALSVLEEIAFQREDFQSLEGVYLRQIEVEDANDRLQELYLKLGGLYEEFLFDNEAAVNAYKQALTLNKGNRMALAGLHRCYDKLQQYDELSIVLEQEIEAVEQVSAKSVFRLELSRLLQEKLMNASAAVMVASKGLQEDPENENLLSFLVEQYEDPNIRKEMFEAFPELLKKLGKWEALERVLLIQVDDLTEPERQAEVFEYIAKLRRDRLDNIDGAMDLMLMAVQAKPTQDRVKDLVEMGIRLHREEDVAGVLEKWADLGGLGSAEHAATIEIKAEEYLIRQLADLYDGYLDNTAGAIKCYEGLTALHGDKPDILQKLADLYRKQGDKSGLLAVLLRILSLEPVERMSDVVKEVSDLAVESGDYGTAIGVLRAYVKAVPSDVDLAVKLEELYRQRGDLDEVYNLLNCLSEAVKDQSRRARILYKLAVLKLEHKGDFDGVVTTLEEVFDLDPQNPEALELCENIAFGGNEEWVISMGSQVLGMLISAYRQAGRTSDLIRCLLAAEQYEPKKQARHELLMEAAHLLDQEGRQEEAFYTYRKVFEEDPTHEQTGDELVRLAGNLGKAIELVDTFNTAANLVSGEARIALLMQAASLMWRHLDRTEDALSMFQKLYQENPTDPRVVKGYLGFLKEKDTPEMRVSFLKDVLQQSLETGLKREMYMELAGALTETGASKEALKAYDSVIEARENPDSLDEMAKTAVNEAVVLAEETEDTRKLFEIHMLAGRLETDTDQKVYHFYAASQSGNRDDSLMQETVDAYMELLKLQPDDYELGVDARKALIRAGKMEQAAQMIVQALSGEHPEDVQFALKKELAGLYLRQIGEKGKAFDLAKDLLEQRPTDQDLVGIMMELTGVEEFRVQALKVLSGAYTAAEAWDRLTSVGLDLVDAVSGQQDLTDYVLELADTLSAAQRVDEAIELLIALIRQTSGNVSVVQRLGDILKNSGRLGQMGQLLKGLSEDVKEGVNLLKYGADYLITNDNLGVAADLLRAYVESIPRDKAAVENLVKVYEQLDDTEGLVFAIGLLADVTEQPDTKKELLLKGGELASSVLKDRDLAEACFMRIFQIEPESLDAFAALERLYESVDDKDALYELHLRAFETLKGGAGDDWKKSGLKLIQEALSRDDLDAAENAVIQVLETGETGAEYIEAAKDVLFRKNNAPQVFQLVESALQQQDLLDLYRAAIARGLEWPSKEEMLKKAVVLEEELGQQELLWEDLMALAMETPDELGLWAKMKNLAIKLDRVDGFAAMLRSVVEDRDDLAVWDDLILMLADILEKENNDVETAEYYLRLLSQRNPENKEAFVRMEGLLLNGERFEELALLYESRAEAIFEPEEKHGLYMEAAKLYLETGDKDQAMDLLDQCITVGWNMMDAAVLLEQTAKETGNKTYLARALATRFENENDLDKRLNLGMELSDFYQELGKLSDAIDVLNLLVHETGYMDTGIIKKLEGLLIQARRFEDLAQLYLSISSVVGDKQDRLNYMKKAAQINEVQLQQIDIAIDLLHQVIDEDSADRYAYSRLVELLKQEDRLGDLENLYRLRLTLDLSPEEQVRTLKDFASLLFEDSRFDEAMDRAGQGLRLQPDDQDLLELMEEMAGQEDVTIRIRALKILETAFQAIPDYEQLVRVLITRVSIEEDVDTKRKIYLQLSEVMADKLEKPQDALEFVLMALNLRIDEHALQVLDRIGDREGLEEAYYEGLMGILDNVEDVELSVRIHKKLAVVASEKLSKPEAAADHLMRCLSLNALDKREMQRLERLLESQDRYQEQVMVLRELISLIGEKDAIRYMIMLGDIYLEKLNDVEGAFEEYVEVLGLLGREETIEDRLLALISDPIVGARAVDVLLPLAEEDLDFDREIQLIEAKIDTAQDDEILSDLYRRLANIYSRIGDHKNELAALGKAMIMHPESETLSGELVSLAEGIDEIGMAMEYLEEAAEKAKWQDVKKDLYLKLVGLAMRKRSDAGKAEKALLSVLDMDPDHVEAIGMLEKIYQTQDKVEEYIRLLEMKTSNDNFMGDRRNDLKKLAELYLKIGEMDKVGDVLIEVLEYQPEDIDALSLLMEVARTTGNRDRLDFLINQIIGLSVVEDAYMSLLKDAAEMALFKLDDKELALIAYEKLWHMDPADRSVRVELIKLLEDKNEWSRLFAVYDAISDREKGRDASDAAKKAGEIAERWMHDTSQAIRMYLRALEQDQNDLESVDELIRLYYDAGYWAELVNILRRKARLIDGGAEKTALYLQAVDLAREKLDDEGLVEDVLGELLKNDPGNVAAMLLLAQQLQKTKKLGKAEAMYKQILKTNPPQEDRVAALIGLASVYTQMKVAPERILEISQKVLEIDPSNNNAVALLKETYKETGDYSRLISMLERFYTKLRDAKEQSRTALDIAQAYLNGMEDEHGFLKWIRLAYDVMPNNPEVVKALVDYYKGKGQLTDARSYLEWLIKYLEKNRKKDDLIKYSKDMGDLLFATGELQEALRYYGLVFRFSPDDVYIRSKMGKVYGRLKQWKNAIKMLQPLLLKMGSMDGAGKRGVLLTLAKAHKELGEMHRMRQYALRILADNPNDEEAEELLNS